MNNGVLCIGGIVELKDDLIGEFRIQGTGTAPIDRLKTANLKELILQKPCLHPLIIKIILGLKGTIDQDLMVASHAVGVNFLIFRFGIDPVIAPAAGL